MMHVTDKRTIYFSSLASLCNSHASTEKAELIEKGPEDRGEEPTSYAISNEVNEVHLIENCTSYGVC